MLYFDKYAGPGEKTVVILHGLFGSAKNFASLAEGLSDLATVYAYDARNHGRSEHRATHSLEDITDDLENFLSAEAIEHPILLGHSMGGLTAMNFARRHSRGARALVILDIAPRSYAPGHENEIAALSIDVSAALNRQEIDAVMSRYLSDPVVRQFLQMNLMRTEAGVFRWMNNVAAIASSPGRTVFPAYNPPLSPVPVLAIRGLLSDYVSDRDVELMRAAFPALEMHDFADAGHWLHYTHRSQVTGLVRGFLQGLSKHQQ